MHTINMFVIFAGGMLQATIGLSDGVRERNVLEEKWSSHERFISSMLFRLRYLGKWQNHFVLQLPSLQRRFSLNLEKQVVEVWPLPRFNCFIAHCFSFVALYCHHVGAFCRLGKVRTRRQALFCFFFGIVFPFFSVFYFCL